MNPSGKIPGTTNSTTNSPASSANKNPVDAMHTFLQSAPFTNEPKLNVPLSSEFQKKLNHIQPYQAVWSSRTDDIPYGTNLGEYISELTEHKNPGNYVVIGQMGIEPGMNTPNRSAVINFIIVEDHIAYMAQVDWGFESQQNPSIAQEQLAAYFENFRQLKENLQGKDIPHGQRLLVVESSFNPEQDGCAWLQEGQQFRRFIHWHKPSPEEGPAASFDLAQDMITQRYPQGS